MNGTFSIFDGNTQLSVSEYTLTGVMYPAPSSPYFWETLDGEITTTFSGAPGTHVLTVKYSGDSNYSPSSSGTVTFSAVYPTQTSLTPSASTILDGQPLTVTAQIVPSKAASSSPSGTVTFNVNGAPFGTIAVSNSQAQIIIPSLTAGNIPITGIYSGDTNYASSSGTLTEAVNPVPTSTSVTASNATVVEGAQVTLTAKITPAQNGAAPIAGTVQFSANGVPLGGQSVSNNQAQITASFSTPGSAQVQAIYSGDVNYLTSTGAYTETVLPPPPDFSITASGTTTQTVTAGQTATFNNGISVSALNGFSAQVSLSCSLPSSATATTCTVNPNTLASGSGTASVSVTTMAHGLVPPAVPLGQFCLRLWASLLLIAVLLAMLLRRLASEPRQRSLSSALPFAGTALFLLLQAIGCGGGGGYRPPPPPVGTPLGTYTVTVSGTSGSTTHTASVTLIVN
jgi:hypothetical protein